LISKSREKDLEVGNFCICGCKSALKRKVPVSRLALQEPNSSDDFVIGKPNNMRIKKSGVKPPKQAPQRMTKKGTGQPIHHGKVYTSS
jgi:hypothetical protein